jgi:circadian clock protein KaiB
MNKYVFKLFVTGFSARSDRALRNIRKICESDLGGYCEIQVVDVLERPEMAEEMKILATPTLIKTDPAPWRRIVGDLSDRKRVLDGLEIDFSEGD